MIIFKVNTGLYLNMEEMKTIEFIDNYVMIYMKDGKGIVVPRDRVPGLIEWLRNQEIK